MLALYCGVLVRVLCERPVTGGVACDVRVVDPAASPWTVSAFTVARTELAFPAAVLVLS